MQALHDFKSLKIYADSDKLDVISGMDKIDSFMQRLDKLGDSRAGMIKHVAIELRNMEPESQSGSAAMADLAEALIGPLHA